MLRNPRKSARTRVLLAAHFRSSPEFYTSLYHSFRSCPALPPARFYSGADRLYFFRFFVCFFLLCYFFSFLFRPLYFIQHAPTLLLFSLCTHKHCSFPVWVRASTYRTHPFSLSLSLSLSLSFFPIPLTLLAFRTIVSLFSLNKFNLNFLSCTANVY